MKGNPPPKKHTKRKHLMLVNNPINKIILWRHHVVFLFLKIFIYIYINIVIYRQSVSLYHNSPVWLYAQDATSWDRNLPNFTLDLRSYRSAISVFWQNTPIQAESLHCLEQAADDIGLHVNADKMEYICFNKKKKTSQI